MQELRGRNTTGTPRGRSTVERLPASVREAVDAAIADGASIDEITALIRENGGKCSRSAVGRYAKRTRDQSRRRDEAVRLLESWRRKPEAGGEDPKPAHPACPEPSRRIPPKILVFRPTRGCARAFSFPSIAGPRGREAQCPISPT